MGCARSPNYPDAYPNTEGCEISVREGGVTLEVSEFSTEKHYDYLTLDGGGDNRTFHGGSSPHLQKVDRVINWGPDGSISNHGWRICAAVHVHPVQGEIY